MPLTFFQFHRGYGPLIDAEPALLAATITAGAGNDGVAVNGPVFDRLTPGREQAKSCCLLIFGTATLAAAQNLTIAAKLQHDTALAFNVNPLDLEPAMVTTTVPLTAPVTAGKFALQLDVDLHPAARYIRAVITANLSAGSIDTVALSAVMILGGQQQYPPP